MGKTEKSLHYYHDRKLNLSEVIRLRYYNRLSFEEIARKYNTDRQAVQQMIARFEKILKPPEEVEAYRSFRQYVFDSAELSLIEEMMKEEKLKKGSINNLGYVFQQIAIQNRLERGLATSNIDIHFRVKDLENKIAEARDFLASNPVQPDSKVAGSENVTP